MQGCWVVFLTNNAFSLVNTVLPIVLLTNWAKAAKTEPLLEDLLVSFVQSQGKVLLTLFYVVGGKA